MNHPDALRPEAEALRLEPTPAQPLAPRNGQLFYPLAAILLVVHGTAMAGWMFLLLLQTLLILFGNTRLHRLLGQVGAMCAATIVTLGLGLAIASTQVTPPAMRIWGLVPMQFLVVPFFSILIFGILVTLGVLNRHRPLLHRPLMLLTTLAVIPAAVSRTDVINHLYEQTVWQGLLSRSWDRVFALGRAGLVAASALIMAVATTRGWDGFAGALLR